MDAASWSIRSGPRISALSSRDVWDLATVASQRRCRGILRKPRSLHDPILCSSGYGKQSLFRPISLSAFALSLGLFVNTRIRLGRVFSVRIGSHSSMARS